MKILVSQVYGIGNAIMCTPMIQAIALIKDGKHEVHTAVDTRRRGTAHVIRTCPGVKSVTHSQEVTKIQQQRFDMLIMCNDHTPLARLYRIPRIETAYINRIGRESRAEWFSRWNRHESLMAFDVARKLGFKGVMPVPHVPTNDHMKVDYAGPKLGIGIGYFKGDAWSRKKHWGNGKYADIIRRFRMLGGRAFLLGDQLDYEKDGREIMKMAGAGVTSLCGKLGLEASFGVLKQMDLYIGNDTGLSHAAAALGIPTLSIFLPWASSFVKTRPLGPLATYTCEWPGCNAIEGVGSWVSRITEAVRRRT